MRLNLGCSTDLRGGEWTNVDLVTPDVAFAPDCLTQFQAADLSLPWPWADSSVDEIYAADIFEHIGDCIHVLPQECLRCIPKGAYPYGLSYRKARHWSGRIHVMNEAHRVLRPGGILTMECPDAAKGAGQWQDPTHVSPWTPNALQYYTDGSPAHKRFAVAYGITARFKVLGVTERLYTELAGDVNTHCVRCDVWKWTARLEAVK